MNCTASVHAPRFAKVCSNCVAVPGGCQFAAEYGVVARALEKLPAILPLLDRGVEIHHVELECHALPGVDGRQRGDLGVIAIGLRGENGERGVCFDGR
jgi:hypothetical protein